MITLFPISAAILQNMRAYDAVLENFSKPLMEQVTQYQLFDDGSLAVDQKTKSYYQYIDFTSMAEYLFVCIEETLDSHFSKELDFLISYDRTKAAMQLVIDMPDKLIDLFIRLLIQHNGMLSKNKRETYFSFLTEEELLSLSEIVRNNMLDPTQADY